MTIDTNQAIVMIRVPTATDSAEEKPYRHRPSGSYIPGGSIIPVDQRNSPGGIYVPKYYPVRVPETPLYRALTSYYFFGGVFFFTMAFILSIYFVIVAMRCRREIKEASSDKAALSKHEEAMNVDIEPVVMHV